MTKTQFLKPKLNIRIRNQFLGNDPLFSLKLYICKHIQTVNYRALILIYSSTHNQSFILGSQNQMPVASFLHKSCWEKRSRNIAKLTSTSSDSHSTSHNTFISITHLLEFLIRLRLLLLLEFPPDIWLYCKLNSYSIIMSVIITFQENLVGRCVDYRRRKLNLAKNYLHAFVVLISFMMRSNSRCQLTQ